MNYRSFICACVVVFSASVFGVKPETKWESPLFPVIVSNNDITVFGKWIKKSVIFLGKNYLPTKETADSTNLFNVWITRKNFSHTQDASHEVNIAVADDKKSS